MSRANLLGVHDRGVHRNDVDVGDRPRPLRGPGSGLVAAAHVTIKRPRVERSGVRRPRFALNKRTRLPTRGMTRRAKHVLSGPPPLHPRGREG